MLGKQWILHYTRVSTSGSVIDRGRNHQVKFEGLQKWGLHFIIRSLPVLLQLALLLFAVALIVYLRDIDVSAARVVLVGTGIGCAFYTCTAVVATIWSDCPFQAPLTVLVLPWLKASIVIVSGWLRHGLRRRANGVLLLVGQVTENSRFMNPIGRLCRMISGRIAPDRAIEDVYGERYSMELANPILWRQDPLFPPIPKAADTTVSAGFWLLEKSVDPSVVTAVAAAFPEFQWSSRHHSTTALVRLSDTYMQYIQTPTFDGSVRRKALQCAAAYYVLYHTWLIWSTSKCHKPGVERLPPRLPSDLLLHNKHGNKWDGDDVFEYLLRIEDRSEPVTSARFLSYIAPYWFCGNSDDNVKSRPTRLPILLDLITALDRYKALDKRTLADCFLCVGAAMDLPLHPEDLIRVDKRCVSPADTPGVVLIGHSYYVAPTFRKVVEHIHRIALAFSYRYDNVTEALEILLALTKHTTLPLIDSVWINELLRCAAEEDMADENFILFLRLSARRAQEVDAEEEDYVLVQSLKPDPQSLGTTVVSETPTRANTLFSKTMRNIQARVEIEGGWQDDAIYGGLVVITGIRLLESSLFDDDVIQTLHDAMYNDKPLRVRKAAYVTLLVTRGQWLK